MAFANLTAALQLNISNFAAGMTEASRRADRFAANLSAGYRDASRHLLTHNLGLKDTARIVQGIMVSQTFYAIAGAIRDAVSAVWDFNKALDYAHVTYSALFGDVQLATNFMNALQQHSIETIFDYQKLAESSKKLLAYGIEYKNLMFIMEGLTNLGAMSGDAAALDRIALALGQIYTRGKLSAEEMRQLANAYVPIYDIVQSKFNLSDEDMGRVGDLNLPAHEVINAVVDYANERFGSVGDAAMYTITGLENKIVDSLKVMGTEMMKPITSAYKSFLVYVSDGLESIRSAFAEGGFGGVFEHLVPDEGTQTAIRQFIANIKNALMALMSIGSVAGQIFGNFAQVFVTAFNIVSPILVGFTNILAATLNGMLNTSTGATVLRVALVAAAGAFVLLKVHALGALVVTAVTKAITSLSKALLILSTIVTRHPVLALLAGLAIALVGVSVSSENANSSIGKLFDTLSGAGGGSSQEDILQRVEQSAQAGADAADQFNNRLEAGSDAAKELEDGINGAGNAAKKAAAGLLSFDEVFKLNEPKDTSGAGAGSGAGGIGDDIEGLIGGLGGLGDALIPDIPDFSDFASDFTDGLFGGISDSMKEKLASIGWGSLIGTALGGIIGGLLGGTAGAKLGMKIGSLAGGIVGLLWEKLDGAMSNTGIGTMTGIVSTIAGAFSKAFGVPLATSLSSALANGGFKAVFAVIGSALKTAGLKSIVKGGLIGAAVGLVTDLIAGLLWNTLEDRFKNADAETARVGQTIGSVIGTVIGAIIGGPPGALIGAAIGTFAGGFVGLFWEPIKEYFNPEHNVLSAFFVKVGNDIKTWAVDSAKGLATWFTDTADGFSDWWTDTSKGFSEWWTNTTSGFSTWWSDTKEGLLSWLDDTVKTFSDWDSINGDTLREWWNKTSTGFSSWFNETTGGFGTWFTNTKTKLSTWSSETRSKLSDWAGTTLSKFTGWALETDETFNGWKRDILKKVGDWASEAGVKISNWASDAVTKISNWTTETKQKFNTWKTDTGRVIEGFGIAARESIKASLTEMLNNVSTKLDGIKTKWSEKWNSIKTEFGIWWTGLKTSMGTWLENSVWKPVGDFFNVDKFWQRIKSLLDGIKRKLSTWWDGITELFDGGISINASVSTAGGATRVGHATGGIFNREHVARFAEGNRAEAVIPLQNAHYMQPFVDAISNGIVSSLAPVVAYAGAGNQNNLPPMYVGTLVADERGIRELYKKFEVIQIQENARRGISKA